MASAIDDLRDIAIRVQQKEREAAEERARLINARDSALAGGNVRRKQAEELQHEVNVLQNTVGILRDKLAQAETERDNVTTTLDDIQSWAREQTDRIDRGLATIASGQ